MSVPPITRSLWSSSRCTRTELQRSIITTRHSPPCRAVHASSLSYPVNYARPKDTVGETEKYLRGVRRKAAAEMLTSPAYESARTMGLINQDEMYDVLYEDMDMDIVDPELGEMEELDDEMFEDEEEMSKEGEIKSVEVEGEKPKRPGRGRPRKIREDVGEGEVEVKVKVKRKRTKPSVSVSEGGEINPELQTPKRRVGRPRKIRDPESEDPKPKKPKAPKIQIRKEAPAPFPTPLHRDNPSNIPYLNLPPSTEWKTAYKDVAAARQRPTLRNPDSATMLAEKFIPEGSKDKIVIDASAGPGLLSRALLNLPRERIKKLIIIEHMDSYFKYLEPLKHIDDRVTVVNLNARDWGTYTKLERAGLLKDVQTTDWDQVHPQLHYIMQMSGGVDGEQVASQLLRTIPDRQWLFKFGRMPMNLILTDRMYERYKAPEDTLGEKSNNIRCKVSVMAQAVSQLSEVVPYDALQPHREHFYPDTLHIPDKTVSYTQLDKRKPGTPRVAIEVMPLQHPLIKPGDLDFWDYITRKLFVVKATPMDKAITALGPGAHNLLKKLETFDLSKNPRQFNVHEWNQLVEVFKAWPFRPTNLGIEQMFAKKT